MPKNYSGQCPVPRTPRDYHSDKWPERQGTLHGPGNPRYGTRLLVEPGNVGTRSAPPCMRTTNLTGCKFADLPSGYSSPKKPRLPLLLDACPESRCHRPDACRRVHDRSRRSRITFVTHSQGGLILQRFLAWMVSEGRAWELARIRTIVMLACPNGGSQVPRFRPPDARVRSSPAGSGPSRVLNKQVADTQRLLLTHNVHASGTDDHHCRIPFHVYAAASDAACLPLPHKRRFPGQVPWQTDTSTILDPTASRNRTADVIKHHILTDLVEQTSAPAQGQRLSIAESTRRGKPEEWLSGTQGLRSAATMLSTTFSPRRWPTACL